MSAILSISSPQKRQLNLDEFVFSISCLTVWILLCLPLEPLSDGSIVPTIVFSTQLLAYRVFGLCLVVSNYCSLCSMLLRKKLQKVALVFEALGCAAMLLAALALKWAVLVFVFRKVEIRCS